MLKDYKGNVMRINKVGAIYPVDVELCQENDKNILYISAKVNFIDSILTESVNLDLWKKSVFEGFKEWAGEYRVFGDQPLTVTVNLSETDKLTDCIFVFCIDKNMSDDMVDTYGKLNMKKLEQVFKEDRSFATAGFPVIGWKTYFPRFVYMLPSSLRDPGYAKTVAKHEFGHVLGLGDLYKDLSLGFCGVEGAQYSDIEPYYLGDHSFDMVMCNNGPVRNNDIEMVLLAFQTNSFQNYQKKKKSEKISKALGKGN